MGASEIVIFFSIQDIGCVRFLNDAKYPYACELLGVYRDAEFTYALGSAVPTVRPPLHQHCTEWHPPGGHELRNGGRLILVVRGGKMWEKWQVFRQQKGVQTCEPPWVTRIQGGVAPGRDRELARSLAATVQSTNNWSAKNISNNYPIIIQ